MEADDLRLLQEWVLHWRGTDSASGSVRAAAALGQGVARSLISKGFKTSLTTNAEAGQRLVVQALQGFLGEDQFLDLLFLHGASS